MQTTLSVADPVEFVAACPVCQGRSFAPLPVSGRWIGVDVFGDLTAQLGLTRCRACRLVFTNPRPSAARLKTFYSADTYACHEEDTSHFAIAKAELILGKLSQCMPPEAAADAPRVARTTALRRIKHLIRDTFLGMGLGENLGVVARL